MNTWCRPTRSGTEGPFFCNRTWPFDANQLEGLKPELTRLWPNIHGGDTVDSLWKHEWDKHGTCAALHPSFASEHLYFNQGLKWVNSSQSNNLHFLRSSWLTLGIFQAKQYHMSKILTTESINPSMTALYNATKIWRVLRNTLGFDPSISCEFDKVRKIHSLIYFYFDERIHEARLT